jgi:hypothetical protein
MDQSNSRPVPLIVACALLLFAVAEFALSDADANIQRRDALMRDQRILREQRERSVADRNALREQTARLSESRSELEHHRLMTFELFRRLDELTARVPAIRGQVDAFKFSPKEPSAVSERPISSLVEVITP